MPSLVFYRASSRRPQLFLLEDRLAPAATWVSQGPGPTQFGQAEGMNAQNNPVSGSIHAIVAHPTLASTMWAGTTNGGIWKTTNATSASPTWTPLTDEFPGLSTGALALDPTDGTSQTLVAGIGRYSSLYGDGGPRTGLLRTTDGGSNWTAITGGGTLTGKNISGVAVRGSTIVISVNYAEPYTYANVGIFRSTDGGNTFSQISQTGGTGLPGGIAFDLATDPTDNTVLYTGIQFAAANDGIYKSTDTGATWSRVSNATMNGLTTDAATSNIELTVGNTHNVFAGVINNGRLAGLFASANGGTSWATMDIPEVVETATTAITGATNASPIVITSTAHGQATGDRVLIQNVLGNTAANGTWTITRIDANSFSLTGSSGNGAYTANSGTWRAIQGLEPVEEDDVGNGVPEPGNDFPPGSQGGTHFSIVADPTTSTIVYVGGDRQPLSKGANTGSFPNAIGANNYSGRLFRGNTALSAGAQWTPLTHNFADSDGVGFGAPGTAPHADSRDMTFDAAGNIIEVDDGGIYKRTLPRLTTGVWSSLHGDIRNTEFHSVAYDNRRNVIIGGTQDTGTTQQTAAGNTTWAEVSQGDGGNVAVDNVTLAGLDQTIRYTGFQNFGGFTRRTYDVNNNEVTTNTVGLSVGGASLFTVDANIGFYQQYELNAVTPARGVIGTRHLYQSADKFDTLTDLAVADPDPLDLRDPSLSGIITAMAYGGKAGGVNNQDVLYYGTSVSNSLYLRTTAGGAFTKLIAYPGGRPQDIILDPDDWNTAYVIDDTSVYRTQDAGGSWTNITGNLAALVGGTLRTISYVNAPSGADGIVIGAAGGVFAAGITAPTVWTVFGPNLPNAVAYDLKYDATDDVLLVGTLGRGAWTLPAASTQFGVGPVVTVSGGSLAYTENDPATVLDAAAAVSDFDSADFNTGSLTVDFSANGTASDRLAVRNQGVGAGQIGVSGSNVTFGGATIGTVAGGVGLTPLTVTFTSALATPAAASALLKNITFANVSDAPSTAIRSVRFVVNDGDGNNSAPATRLVSVTAVNDVPVAQVSNVTTNEDIARSFLVADFGFTDAEGEALASITVSALFLTAGDTLTVDQGAGAVPVTNGMTITAAELLTMTYTPLGNASGAARASFNFKVNDAGLGTVAAAMTINVTAVNDVPVATANSFTILEDATKVFAVADFPFTDIEGNPLASITVSNPVLGTGDTLMVDQGAGPVVVTNGMTILAARIPTLTYTPLGNAFGPARATFDFTVNDAGLGVVAAAMTINVTAVNDVPVAVASNVTTNEDIAKQFAVADFGFTDAEGNPLVSITVSGLALTAGDALTVNTGTVVPVTNGMTITAAQIPTMLYTPLGNANGTPRSSFNFTVNDAGAGAVSAAMAINVTPVNDVPVATANSVTIVEGATKVFAVADFPFTDIEGNPLASITVSNRVLGAGDTLTANLGAGAVAVTNGMTITAAQILTLTYTPAVDGNGAARAKFDFKVNDGGLGTVAATMTINVTAVNDTPSFTSGGDVYVLKNAGAKALPWATAISAGPPDEALTQTVTFTVSADDTSLFTVLPTIDVNGVLKFTTTPTAVGSTTIHVTLTDGAGGADTSADQPFQFFVGINRAPTLDGTGDPMLTPMASPVVAMTATAVGDFAAVGAADLDGTPVGGAAVTAADTANGRWEFSTDAGLTWGDLARADAPVTTVAFGAARLLRPEDLVRFIPTSSTFVGKATLGYHAWDQFDADVNDPGDVIDLTGQTGGNGPYSAAAGTATLRVAPVFVSQIEDKAPVGKAVGALEVADADSPALPSGIAVVGAGGAAGRWEFSPNGSAWKRFAAIDPAHATLLPSTYKVRFIPAKDQYGDAFLAVRAWDQSAGKAGTTEDLSAATEIGGATPFSATVDYLFSRVAEVNDRPVLDVAAATVLTRVPTTATDPAGDLVSAIVGATVTDVDPKDIPGIAVTAAGKTGGEWQYSLDGGLNWIPVLTGPPSPPNPKLPALSVSSALPLGPNDLLRFVPTFGVSGTSTLSYKVWDGSKDAKGISSVHGVRANTNLGTAFSAGVETATLEVTDVTVNANNAPELNATGTVTLSAVAEDTVAKGKPAYTPAGNFISVLLGDVTDAEDTATPVAKRGAAVTGLSGAATGVWQFSFDGKAWKPAGVVSEASALLLRDTDHLRYLPAKNFTGTVGVTFRAWDQTRGTVGGRAGLAVPGTTGGATPFSDGVGTATLAVTPTADAPVLNLAPKPVFTTVVPGATNPAGDLVSRLLGTALTDPDGNALQGIAVVSAPATHGTWEFKSGAGAWVPFNTATAISPTHALFLQDTDLVRFKPASTFKGTVSLGYYGWDQSAGPTAVPAGRYGKIADFGSAVSKAKETASVTVTAVNTRPVLDTKPDVRLPALPTTGAGNTNPAGTSAAALLGTAVTDPDASGLLPGIAVTAVSDVDNAHGVWQFSTNNGVSWSPIATVANPIAKGKGVLLRSTDLIRFRPNAGYVGAATFSYKAWDRTTGGTIGSQVATNTLAFSTAIEIATVAVNTAPDFTY